MPWVPVDIVGKRYGRLVVQAYLGRSFWRCLCDCGNESRVKTDALNSGKTRSCGCLHADTTRARSLKHGHSPREKITKGYSAWINMRQRCTNPQVTKYGDYGGRGIRVCDRWQDFENFLADMGEPPPGMTLDRIDVNGDYEPANCRWANMKVQQNNRRNNHLLTFNGETHGVTEWERRTTISRHTLLARERLGWPVEEIFSKRDTRFKPNWSKKSG